MQEDLMTESKLRHTKTGMDVELSASLQAIFNVIKDSGHLGQHSARTLSLLYYSTHHSLSILIAKWTTLSQCKGIWPHFQAYQVVSFILLNYTKPLRELFSPFVSKDEKAHLFTANMYNSSRESKTTLLSSVSTMVSWLNEAVTCQPLGPCCSSTSTSNT